MVFFSVVISTLANMVSKEIKTNHDLALRKNLNVIMNWILDNDMPMYIKDKLTESLEYVSSSVRMPFSQCFVCKIMCCFTNRFLVI